MIKKILKIFGALLLIALFFILALPTILSQNSVNQFILNQVNARIPGKMAAKELHLGWMSGIDLQEFSLKDPQGREVIELKRVQLSDSLLSLLTGSAKLHHLVIERPKCLLIEEQDGSYSIEHAFTTPAKTHEKRKHKSSSKTAVNSSSLTPSPASSTTFPTLLAEVNVHDGLLTLEKPNTQPMVVDNFSCKLVIQGTQDATVIASAIIKQGEKSGVINLEAHAKHFQDLVPAYKQKFLGTQIASTSTPIIQPDINLNCTLKTFPIEIADSILSISNPTMKGLLLSAIGDTLDLQVQHNYSTDTLGAACTIKSQNIDSAFVLQSVDNNLQLTTPTLFRFQISPTLFKKFIPDDTYTLLQATTAQCTIQPVTIPLPLSSSQPIICAINFDSPLMLKGKQGEFMLQPKLKLETTALHEFITASARLQMSTANAGATLACTMNIKNLMAHQPAVELELDTTGNIEAMAATIGIYNKSTQECLGKELNLHVKAEVSPKKPITIETLFTNQLLALLLKDQKNALTLPDPAKIVLTLNSIEEIQATHSIKGMLEIPTITPFYQNVAIGSYTTQTNFKISDQGIEAVVDLAAHTSPEQSTPATQAHTTLSIKKRELSEDSPADLPATIKCEGRFQDLPLKIIGELLHKKELFALIGDTTTGSWKIDYQGMSSSNNFCNLNVTAKNLDCDLNIAMINGVITPVNNKKPFTCTMQLHQDRLQALLAFLNSNSKPTLRLENTATIELNCNQLQIPLLQILQNKEGTLHGKILDGIDLNATLKMDQLQFQTLPEKSAALYTIAPLKGQIRLKQGSRNLLFELQPESASSTDTTISIKGNALNLWDDTGLTLKNAHLEMDANLNQLPVDVIQRLGCSEKSGEKIVALIGPKLNATIKSNIKQLHEGVFEAQIRSQHLQTTFFSTLNKGVLQLTQPAVIRLEITPEAGKMLFQGVNPSVATAIRVKDPITITIDDKNFAFPIKSFSKKAIRMNMMRVDLGQMEVKKGGILDVISTLLSLNSRNDMQLWFTPLYLEMANGVITCKRVDALLDNQLQIASWGTVDIVNDQVDMVIGILGEGLRRSLYLQTLSPNYVLQLPIKGKMATASIDKTRATAKIASLRMREGTNQTQAILGGILGVVAAVGEEESPVPPPTTHPFPWRQ